jgi:hypothetical protein
MPMDFSKTRATLDLLDRWFDELASPLVPLKRVSVKLEHLTGFIYEFREPSERALLVGKAARVVSGIRAAMILADMGYIAECGALLRSVSDFSSEIICICDGIKANYRTRAHKDFVDQYFTKLPKNPDEHAESVKVDWVRRDQLWAALYRWAVEHKVDQSRLRLVMRYLGNMYDKFAHGHYITSSELYNPFTWKFMLRGHESEDKRDEYRRSVASKLHEALTALSSIADCDKNSRLVVEICLAAKELYESSEL